MPFSKVVNREAGKRSSTVRLNGKPAELDRGDADEFSEFFAPLDASGPVESVRNEIVVTVQAGTAITAVQLLTL